MARKTQGAPPARPPSTSPSAPGPEAQSPSSASEAARATHAPASPPLAPPDVAFPIVAIGASAGGIEAVRELLESLPGDTGMGFVVIQHLSPAHHSMLAEILGRATRMPVAELAGDTRAEPNHVYVIAPNSSLVFERGSLRLAPRPASRGPARAIDDFMRSLAEGHGAKSIGVVLSGTGSDGTVGLEEIKAAGGLTFAQDATAEQNSMPASAIAAGVVDLVLPPDEIAGELARIAHHPYVGAGEENNAIAQDPAFMGVLEVLHRATGADFSRYKPNTLQRRIARRLVLHKLGGLPEYLRLLESKPEEVQALYQDVLINVTSFFRDPEAYEALKARVFPQLCADRGVQDPLRVWCVGCSTGEEAYSLAMAYVEFAERTATRVPLQIFATDVNGASIDHARAGLYPKSAAEDVSPERLHRFFVAADGGWSIAKSIRDVCVFARHNVLSDPPFSRIDLVSCRNVLIYLQPVLQQRLIPLLHYALRPPGFLWLGGSETIGSYRDLFELIDTKHKIYARKSSKRPPTLALPVPGSSWGAERGTPRQRARMGRTLPPTDPLREADRILLSRYAPPGVLLNEALDVIQFRGDTSPFLSPGPGRASLSVLRMLREGLLVAVRDALSRARRDKGAVREEGLRVHSDSGWREVDVVVIPVRGGDGEGAFLVLFQEPAQRLEAHARALVAEARAAAGLIPAARDEESGKEIARLKQELGATREYLQSVIEQQEAANEELQSANEEIQSANEELQSINEELETSKEELQSSNEELATVNDEMQHRNLELAQSNDDLTNLFANVNVAIVMLGPDLRIRRFTQPAEKTLNLIHADLGRPLSDINLNIDVPDLQALVEGVLRDGKPVEREVRDRDERCYSLRVRPYRTFENKIDGLVLMLVETDNRRA